MMEGQQIEVACLLCHNPTEDCIRIGRFGICAACEHRLIHTAPGHSDYDELVARLKPIGVSALLACAAYPALEVDLPS